MLSNLKVKILLLLYNADVNVQTHEGGTEDDGK